jgi:hypothetical protein
MIDVSAGRELSGGEGKKGRSAHGAVEPVGYRSAQAGKSLGLDLWEERKSDGGGQDGVILGRVRAGCFPVAAREPM